MRIYMFIERTLFDIFVGNYIMVLAEDMTDSESLARSPQQKKDMG